MVTNPPEDIECLEYNDTLSNLLQKHAPLITKEVILRPNSPWYTAEIGDAKRIHRKAERVWLSTKLTVHLEICRTENLKVTTMCKEAKTQYYCSQITECGTDQKALFEITNRLLHNKKESSFPDHDNPKALANRFAEFFSDKIKTISKNFDVPNLGTIERDKTPLNSKFEKFCEVKEQDIKKIVMASNSKCCHLDPLPTYLIKESIDCLHLHSHKL